MRRAGASSSEQLAQQDNSVPIVAGTAGITDHYTQGRQTVWKTSSDSHGAVHDIGGASHGAGAARVVRGVHHLTLDIRCPAHAIWHQHGQIRGGHVNAHLFPAHGEGGAELPFQGSSVWLADSKLLDKRRLRGYLHSPGSLRLVAGLCWSSTASPGKQESTQPGKKGRRSCGPTEAL